MPETIYDLAFSFAGEQRDYVRQTADACKDLGLRVFYDKDMNNQWWGKNYVREQRQVYSSRTRFFVSFISADYLAKPVPMDEFESAMMTAVKQGDGYILPVLMDDSQVPAELLHPHIHYLKASDYTPEQLAMQFAERLKTATESGQQPEDLSTVVDRALQLRLPKITPNDWSKYEELDRIFDGLGSRFESGADELRRSGLAAHVRKRDDKLSVRVERQGETIGGLEVGRDSQFGDDKITWSVGVPRGLATGINGWATPRYDVERSRTVLEISDLASMGRNQIEDMKAATEDQLFRFLWGMVIDQIER